MVLVKVFAVPLLNNTILNISGILRNKNSKKQLIDNIGKTFCSATRYCDWQQDGVLIPLSDLLMQMMWRRIIVDLNFFYFFERSWSEIKELCGDQHRWGLDISEETRGIPSAYPVHFSQSAVSAIQLSQRRKCRFILEPEVNNWVQ